MNNAELIAEARKCVQHYDGSMFKKLADALEQSEATKSTVLGTAILHRLNADLKESRAEARRYREALEGIANRWNTAAKMAMEADKALTPTQAEQQKEEK